MSRENLNDFLTVRGAAEDTRESLLAELDKLAIDTGLQADLLAKVVIFTGRVLDVCAQGDQARSTDSNERANALKTLTQDPRVYHMIDWWDKTSRTGGHGVHYTRGITTDPQLLKTRSLLTQGLDDRVKQTGMLSDYRNRGKGLVLQAEAMEDYDGYILYFEKDDANTSRPNVCLLTVMPKGEAYDHVHSIVDQDPNILLELLELISPENVAGSTQGVTLVSSYVMPR